jgi:single-strand DNA-binding protein
MNKVILLGRNVKEVDVRYTNNQKVVATFTIAVDKFENGEKSASFVPCVAFGKIAETIGNYIGKGDRVLVEGSLNVRSYEAKDGSKRYVTEVFVNRIDFIERKEKVDATTGGFDSMGSVDTDSIPF